MDKKPINRRSALLCLFILLFAWVDCSQAASQGDKSDPGFQTGAGKGYGVRATEKGLFTLSMSIGGKDLGVGMNDLRLAVRDRQDKAVTGAEITVTPWMPEHGHGVWEKPLVTETGGGEYRVDNVVLIMGGLWEMRVSIRKGADEDRATFSFDVGDGGEAPKAGKGDPEGKYRRTKENYKVPDVTLLTQDGRKVLLRSFLDSGKPVIVDFIFTTCTTICPILSAGYAGLRDELGGGARSVHLVSITIDPEHDRPDRLKEYLERYDAGEGWDFLTGSRDDIILVMKAFDAMASDKMAHKPLYILRSPGSAEWVRVEGLIGAAELMSEFRAVAGR